jgi:hypothetical protein
MPNPILIYKMIVLPEVSDITYFINEAENLGRSSNDFNNKVRENIINCMSHIDNDYFSEPTHGNSWRQLKTDFDAKMRLICAEYFSYKIQHKAGRGYNYDYLISFYDQSRKKIADEKIEFKFNASTIDEAPQFVSPMKPSQYLSRSFEDYYYDNYLVPLLQQFGLDIPERNLYVKSIHNNKPKCMEASQLLYYQGCKQSSKYNDTEEAIKFYQACNDSSRECIKKFIETTDLDIEKLNQYLSNSQESKNYLLYKNNTFHIQASNKDDYIIVSYTKNPEKSRYEALTKSNKKITILLRWKNGNGIAYPAFQIS